MFIIMNIKILPKSISYFLCLAFMLTSLFGAPLSASRVFADPEDESEITSAEQSDSTDDNSDSLSSGDDDSDKTSDVDDSDTSSSDDESETATSGDAAISTDRSAPPAITSKSGIVMDVDTGTVLYEKDIYEKRYPASITKVMTALLALENGNLNDVITVSANTVDNTPLDSAHMGLVVNEQITLREALYAMLLGSANDAAYAIAEHIAGSLPAFVDMMNNKAAELGCQNTHFTNAGGLHDADHYTCAYDMALIGRAVYAYSDFIEISATPTYTIPPTNKSEEFVLWNGNMMLFETSDDYYPYATCGKTGYTPEANETLIAFAERNGTRLVSVLMDAKSEDSVTYKESATIMDFCFTHFHIFNPLEGFSFDKETLDSAVLTNYYHNITHTLPNLSTDMTYTLYTRNYINVENIERTVIMDNTSTSPVVGKIVFSFEGQTLGEVDIINNDYTPAPPPVIISENKAKKPSFEFHWYYLIILAIIIILCVILVEVHILQKKRSKRKRSKKIHSYPAELPIKAKKEATEAQENEQKTDDPS